MGRAPSLVGQRVAHKGRRFPEISAESSSVNTRWVWEVAMCIGEQWVRLEKEEVGQQRGRTFSNALIQRILLCCLFLKIYLVIWKSELQEGEKQNKRISCIYWLTPQLAIFAWAGPVGYQESGVSFKSLTWVAGAQHAGCFLLLFSDHSQRARLKAEQLALEWVFYGIQDRQWEVNLPCHNAIPKSVL